MTSINFHSLFIITIYIPGFLSSNTFYSTVYGKVTSGTPAVTETTVSYIDCLKLCMARPSCVVAYGYTNCQLYDFNSVQTVAQLTVDNHGSEDYVSFRDTRTSDTCPAVIGPNPPTYDGYPATGVIVSNDVQSFYRISYNDGSWIFETMNQTTQIACDQYWQVFTRRYGTYCLRWVDRQYGSNCSAYATAIATDPYFSGIESSEELQAIQWGISQYGIIYLNAKVTPECRSTGNCDNIMLGTYVTPPSRIPWLPGYPTATGDCVAATTFDNITFGLINTECNNGSDGTVYCVYFPS